MKLCFIYLENELYKLQDSRDGNNAFEIYSIADKKVIHYSNNFDKIREIFNQLTQKDK